MSVRTPLSNEVCPVARSLDILGDPWTLLILREVFAGNRRFESLKDELRIADTVLSKRLQRLVEAGLLNRSPYGGSVRPRVEYLLTEAGETTRHLGQLNDTQKQLIKFLGLSPQQLTTFKRRCGT